MNRRPQLPTRTAGTATLTRLAPSRPGGVACRLVRRRIYRPPSRRGPSTLEGLGRPPSHPRKRLSADVLVIPRSPLLSPFWATTEAIGSGGMFVQTRSPPPIDAEVLVAILLHEQPSPTIRLSARVVHRLPGAGFGCRFDAQTEGVARQLSAIAARAAAAPSALRTISRRRRETHAS